MKVEMVVGVSPAAAGNYDITGSSPSGDMVGAIFLNAASTSENTNVNSLRFGFGATDLVSNLCVGQGGQNAIAGAGIRSMLSSTNCMFTPSGLGGQVAPLAAYSSTLSAGVRLALAASPAPVVNRITQTLLISGSDVQMKVSPAVTYFAAADTTHVVAHGMSGTPDVLIFLGSVDVASNTNEVDGKGFFIGFWDRVSGAMSSVTYRATTAANPTDNTAYASNASIGEALGAAATTAHFTVASVGGTNFTINASAASGINVQIGWVALRGVSNQMFSKNSLTSLPIATGIVNLINGMGGQPQCCFVFPTRLTTGNSTKSDDTAGSIGLGISATNDFVTTTNGAIASTFQDNVATSNAANMTSNTLGLLSQDNSGAQDVAATVQNWNTDGVDFNYTNVGASAFEAIVLAFGLPAVSSATPFPFSRTTFFQNDQVVYG